MTRSFVLIKAKSGKDADVLRSLKKVPDIKEAYLLTGKYDAVAILSIDSHYILDERKRVAEVVMENIRKIPGVLSTVTHIPIDARPDTDDDARRTRGFALIKTRTGESRKAMIRISEKVREVNRVHLLFGNNDLLAEIAPEIPEDTDPSAAVAHIVTDRICGRMPEVTYTETYVPLGYSEN